MEQYDRCWQRGCGRYVRQLNKRVCEYSIGYELKSFTEEMAYHATCLQRINVWNWQRCIWRVKSTIGGLVVHKNDVWLAAQRQPH